MDKDFSICKYLLSKTENDEQMEAHLRMVCVAMAKDVPEEKRKRLIRPFFTDIEFMGRIAGWMNELPEAITCGQHEFADWLELFMMSAEAEREFASTLVKYWLSNAQLELGEFYMMGRGVSLIKERLATRL